MTMNANVMNRRAGATGAAGAAAPTPPPPFSLTIELFYHANNFASDVRNVINESELIVAGRHWSMIGKFICAIVKYDKTNYSTINLVVYSSKG